MASNPGYRLALVSAPREKAEGSKGEDEVRAILPKKTLWELSRLLADGDEDIKYECGENHLFFNVDGRQLISRMIDAQFPAYERVIPTGNDKKVEFERDRLASAIKRVALLSSESLAVPPGVLPSPSLSLALSGRVLMLSRTAAAAAAQSRASVSSRARPDSARQT